MTMISLSISRKQLMLLLLDCCIILLAQAFAHLLRLGEPVTPASLANQFTVQTGASVLTIFFHVIALYVLDCYSLADNWARFRNLVRPAVAAIAAGLALSMAFYLAPQWSFGRGLMILQSSFVLLGTVCTRLALSSVVTGPHRSERILIVGAGKSGRYLAQTLIESCQGRAVIAGFMDIRPEKEGMKYFDVPVHAPRMDALQEQIRAMGVDRVIITGFLGWNKKFVSALLDARVEGLRMESMAEAFKRLLGRVPVANVDTSFFLFGPGFALNRNGVLRNVFRIIDVGVAAIGMIVASPLFLLTALVTLLMQGRPVIFAQERAGLNRRPFKLFKFRTMVLDAEEKDGPQWSQENDFRVTGLGRFLRRTRLDELPQLWNVLRGDMSLVGPRPEREHFVRDLEKQIPFYGLRFAVRPGVTGWAQVNFGYGASVEDAKIKLEYDLFYVQEMSPLLYLLIILKTVQTVLMRRGS
jgi:exopolysaccharide biosynthesis polyprenyl glycosylphosphotransferase